VSGVRGAFIHSFPTTLLTKDPAINQVLSTYCVTWVSRARWERSNATDLTLRLLYGVAGISLKEARIEVEKIIGRGSGFVAGPGARLSLFIVRRNVRRESRLSKATLAAPLEFRCPLPYCRLKAAHSTGHALHGNHHDGCRIELHGGAATPLDNA
jgi:hypothetical protein